MDKIWKCDELQERIAELEAINKEQGERLEKIVNYCDSIIKYEYFKDRFIQIKRLAQGESDG